jgi:Xaa-Pro aminopeptidase
MEPIGYNKKRASEVLNKHKIDLLIATTPVNVFYTTGIPTLHVAPNPILFVLYNQFPYFSMVRRDGDVNLLIWIAYASVKEFSWVTNYDGIMSPKMALQILEERINQLELANKTIGIETLMPRYQSEFLKSKFPNANFVDADQAFLEMRLIKSEEEIKRIKKSTEISEKAIMNMIDAYKEGISDIELLEIARRTVIDEGAEGWDHLTMNIGPSDPEAPGTGVVAKPGDVARFDIGTVWKGYVSDVSREAVIGDPPEKVKTAMDNIIQVQEYCIDNIKPGVDPKESYKGAQKFFKSISKRGRMLITAHSIGLECEETHLFSLMGGFETLFEENMVLDIEAWQNVTGQGLIGVEDCYRVSSTGLERLSSLDKDIFIK